MTGIIACMQMPQPDQGAIDRRAEIAAALRRILPAESVIEGEDARRPYESDGLTAYRQSPLLVALPATDRRSLRDPALLP